MDSPAKESETEEVIAELCLNTPSDSIKFCLRKYQYGKDLNQIGKDFEREKRETLRETANFLQIPNYLEKTKKALAHLIVCRIQNLLPDDCMICERRYKISLQEHTILECGVCGQGVHKPCWLNLTSISTNNTDLGEVDAEQFKKLYNPLNLPGLVYICDYCKPSTIPSKEEGNIKRKKRPEDATNTHSHNQYSAGSESTNTNNENLNTDDTPQSQNEESTAENDTGDLEENNNIDENRESHQWHATYNSEENNEYDNNKHDNNEHSNNTKHPSTCRFFQNGNCKHGLKGRECNYTHPKMCRRFMQHGTRQPRGCTQGKRCNDFHPKMCFDSLRKGECFTESCRYTHIKGTRRHPPITRNEVVQNNIPDNTQQNDKDTQHQNYKTRDEPQFKDNGHFLEVVRLLKEDILETLNRKMSTIQNQVHQLQLAYQPQPLQTQPTQAQIQVPTMPRQQIQYPPQQMTVGPLMQHYRP